MKCPLIIGNDGKLYTSSMYGHKDLIGTLKKTVDMISKWEVTTQKIFMNEADYNDIMKWSKE